MWINLACNSIIAVSCVAMPYLLRELFKRHKIGYSLDGWFPAISAVMLTSSVFWMLDAAEFFWPSLVQYELVVKVAIAASSVTAAVMLFFHERKLMHDSRSLVQMITDMDMSLHNESHKNVSVNRT